MRCIYMFICLFHVIAGSLFAQQPLGDPNIPDGETAVYTVKNGKEKAVMTQRILKKTDNGHATYEVTSESSLDDMKVMIDAHTMTVKYSWVRRKRPGLVVETETKTIKNTIKTKADEISIADFAGLVHILRGFPFGRLRTMKLRMAQGSDFVFNAVNTKEVDIKTSFGTIRCYEIELGMDGFLGAFMPKTYFWYSRRAPHFLVRFQGQMGGAGSLNLVMELTSYHIK